MTLVLLALSKAAIEVILNLQDKEVSASTENIWNIIFAILVALWVRFQAEKEQLEIGYGYEGYIYLLWPITLPYFLLKTRGVEGVVTYFGFVALNLAPFLAGLVAYAYYS